MKTSTKRWSAAGFVFIGLVAGILLTSYLGMTPQSLANRPLDDKPILTGNNSPLPEELIKLQDTGKAFTMVAKEILPTVVSISTEKKVKASEQPSIFPDWFGHQFQVPQEQYGLGSGIIVSSDGYILTNHHVINGSDKIKVTLYDNREFVAKVVGSDPLTEVGLIKIDGKDLPVARLGDSDQIEVGEWVLAVGNPLELLSTVTAGIISAKGRGLGIIRDNTQTSGGSYAIENFLQTDAAINPGNSGGALVNTKAEVIGINTAIKTGTGYYTGAGFAIPINLAKRIMQDLVEHGHVIRPWLGISMVNMDNVKAEHYGMEKPRGVLVEQVLEDSPAEKAGLKPLDVILKLDGKEILRSNQVQSIIALKKPGDKVELTILRDKKEKDVSVVLGQRDTGSDATADSGDQGISDLGISVVNLTPQQRDRLNMDGVLVNQVDFYSTAYEEGIREGDVITRIEDDFIKSVNDYRRALRTHKKGDVVIFYIYRNGQKYHAFIKL